MAQQITEQPQYNIILDGKKIIKKISILLLLIISLSCSSQKKITKVYKFKEAFVAGKLILKDSTFTYFYDTDLGTQFSKGTWTKSSSHLKLKSYESFRSNYLIVDEKESVDKIYIKILNEQDQVMRKVAVNVDDFLYFTDNDGIINLKEKPKKITVAYIEHMIYIPESVSSNVFIMKMIEYDSSKRYFDDTFEIDDDKVIIDGIKYLKQN